MLTRLYVDNFKTFVNFDVDFENLCILLGPNGSGKSGVLHVLRRLRDFVGGALDTTEAFETTSLTRWEMRTRQTFELRARRSDGEYAYSLQVDHDTPRRRCRVMSESLLRDGMPLFKSSLEDGQLRATLFRDNHSQGPDVLVDWTRSGLSTVPSRHDNQRLVDFREYLRRVVVLRFDPPAMAGRADHESPFLAHDASNFVAWFRYMTDLDMGLAERVKVELHDAMEGLSGLKLEPDGGNAKILKLRFRSDGAGEQRGSHDHELDFDELSDGQRVLFALASLLCCAPEKGYTLCLDEPENFLALREIHPWLNALIDRAHGGSLQAVLISHHPELINTLASGCGRWLDRPAGAGTRCSPISAESGGISTADLIERGWLHV